MAEDKGSGSSSLASVTWKVHPALVTVQLAYGLSYVLGKVALTTGVSPIIFATYRDVVCLLVLVPIAYFAERGKRTPMTIPVLALIFGVGFFGAFVTQLLSLYGLLLTSAAYTSTISVLAPFFTFVISVSCGFELIRWKQIDGQAKVGGLVSAVTGAVVLAIYVGPVVLGPLDSGLSEIPLSDVSPSELLTYSSLFMGIGPWQIGVACLFFAGFFLSVSISIQAPILARYPAPISVSAFAYFFGAAFLFSTALLTTGDFSEWVISDRITLISIIYNGLIPAAMNFTLLIWCVQKAGPILVASYIPLQLFTAAAMAYLFLGESIHLGSVIGTLLIIIGLVFITWGKIKSQEADSATVKAVPPLDGLPVVSPAVGLEEPLLG